MKTGSGECRGSDCGNHHKERPRVEDVFQSEELSAKHSAACVGKESGWPRLLRVWWCRREPVGSESVRQR